MQQKSSQFIKLSEVAVTDMQMRSSVGRATTAAYNGRQRAMREVDRSHGEALRQQAATIKRYALNNLADLLESAETNMQANGIEVLWAADSAEACRHVLDIARRHGVRTAVKSKSMVTEEIGLNDALEAAGIEPIETDLGEYIVQLDHDTPSHIIAPIIHKSKAEISHIFETTIDMPPTDDTATMARYARGQLREAFLSAEMGISGGNFIIAETGSIGLVTNEGNGRMVTTMPPVHVALIGIEKIAATVADYATLTQILPRSATGQKLAVYTNMVNGPRRADEEDGPEHVYVILIDNGRADIYATSYAEALACLRCGACLNACPVYAVAGGHSYGWVYGGPIGAVITPLLTGLENASPLPYASSLCGECKQVCPVDIDLPRMLLELRHDLIAAGKQERTWQWGMKAWAYGFSSPGRYKLGGKLASTFGNALPTKRLPGPLGGWTDYRSFPPFAKQSFRDLWQERIKQDE